MKTKLISLAFILLGLVATASLTYASLTRLNRASSPAPTSTPPSTPTPSPTPTPDPLRPRTFLLLGYMGGTHAGGALTDTLILAQAEPKKQLLNLISLPRDLWVTYQSTTKSEGTPLATTSAKLNSLYHQGGQETPAERLARLSPVIKTITGLEIEAVLTVNQAGLLVILEKLAPLEVQVPLSFEDPYYPLAGEENNPCHYTTEEIASLSAQLRGFELEKAFPCRYETIRFSAGRQALSADELIKFVRSRHSGQAGGDFQRAKRQQALLIALRERLTKPSTWLELPSLTESLFRSVESSLSLPDLLALIPLLGEPQAWQVHTLTLDINNVLEAGLSADRQYILQPRAKLSDGSPDWQAVTAFIQAFLDQPSEKES